MEDADVEVWPENFTALQALQKVGTRWAVGMSGVIGIRWEAFYPVLDRMNLAPKDYDAMIHDLEVMEGAAVKAMNADN